MFTNEIIATINGPYIQDVSNYFTKGGLGFDKKVEPGMILLKSHEDVANTVLDDYGILTPIELMELSQKEEAFTSIWQNGEREKMPITYDAMVNAKNSFPVKTLSKTKK